eukprot:3225009-Rhodomonas_salina.6
MALVERAYVALPPRELQNVRMAVAELGQLQHHSTPRFRVSSIDEMSDIHDMVSGLGCRRLLSEISHRCGG